MVAKGKQSSIVVSNDLLIERVFNAPRELVWRAWTDPEQIVRWWGPADYTVTVCKIDLRVGGRYLICERSAEGADHWSTGVYREIVKLRRIVCTYSFADESGTVVPASQYGISADFPLEMLVSVTFEEQGGKTKMTLRHAGFPAGEDVDGPQQGWNESFDKLAAILATA